MAAFLQLVAEGKVTPGKLVTHRFKFDDALDAYQVLLGIRKEPYLGIVLEYGSGDKLELENGVVQRRVNFNHVEHVEHVDKVGVSFIGQGTLRRLYFCRI